MRIGVYLISYLLFNFQKLAAALRAWLFLVRNHFAVLRNHFFLLRELGTYAYVSLTSLNYSHLCAALLARTDDRRA